MENLISLCALVDIVMIVSLIELLKNKKPNKVLDEIIVISCLYISICGLTQKNYFDCIIWLGFAIIWLYPILSHTTNRKFEIVKYDARKTFEEVKLPTRATTNAMAYDFYANDDYTVKPNEIVKIWTDVKCYMQEDEGLILNVRSSMGGKFMLANTQGWVDSDYYSNESNDGNIGFFLKNISNETQTIKYGERIGQGMFVKYFATDNDKKIKKNKRKGGFGSTNE